MTSGVWCAATVVAAATLCWALARAPSRSVAAVAGRGHPGLRRPQREHRVVRWWTTRRRARERRAAWASVAEELSATLRSGASLQQATASVAAQTGGAADVIESLLGPVTRGRPMAEVARAWAERATDRDERLLAEALHLAAAGGRAEPLLFDEVAEVIHEHRALESELRAQTSQARASAVVLGLLPVAFTGLVAMSDPDVTAFLFGQPAGRACLAIGLAFEGCGAWWMRRTIQSVLS